VGPRASISAVENMSLLGTELRFLGRPAEIIVMMVVVNLVIKIMITIIIPLH